MLLLDTCSFLWIVTEQTMLSSTAIKTINKYAGNIFISAISAFEIGIKSQRGLLQLPYHAEKWFAEALTLHGFLELPINSKIAMRATQLPTLHKDPADRIIIATAQIHHLIILTPDDHIHSYPDTKVVW